MKKNNKVKDIEEYKKYKKNKHNKRLKKKVAKIMIKVSLFSLVFATIIANISGQVILAELSYEIHYLEKELREENIRLGELEERVDIQDSINEIEKRAKEELNMDYVKKDQIRYIQIDN